MLAVPSLDGEVLRERRDLLRRHRVRRQARAERAEDVRLVHAERLVAAVKAVEVLAQLAADDDLGGLELLVLGLDVGHQLRWWRWRWRRRR